MPELGSGNPKLWRDIARYWTCHMLIYVDTFWIVIFDHIYLYDCWRWSAEGQVMCTWDNKNLQMLLEKRNLTGRKIIKNSTHAASNHYIWWCLLIVPTKQCCPGRVLDRWDVFREGPSWSQSQWGAFSNPGKSTFRRRKGQLQSHVSHGSLVAGKRGALCWVFWGVLRGWKIIPFWSMNDDDLPTLPCIFFLSRISSVAMALLRMKTDVVHGAPRMFTIDGALFLFEKNEAVGHGEISRCAINIWGMLRDFDHQNSKVFCRLLAVFLGLKRSSSSVIQISSLLPRISTTKMDTVSTVISVATLAPEKLTLGLFERRVPKHVMANYHVLLEMTCWSITNFWTIPCRAYTIVHRIRKRSWNILKNE